jgi:hypothetical protein
MVQDRCPIRKAARGRGEWVEEVMEEVVPVRPGLDLRNA